MASGYPALASILTILGIVLQLLILRYLLTLEKIGCKCAMDWRRDYIMFYLGLLIVFSLVNLFLTPDVIPLLQSSMFVLGVLNVVFVLQYVHRLKKEKCECSASVYREVMYILAVINAFLYALILLLLVIALFSFGTYLRARGGVRAIKDMNVRKVKA